MHLIFKTKCPALLFTTFTMFTAKSYFCVLVYPNLKLNTNKKYLQYYVCLPYLAFHIRATRFMFVKIRLVSFFSFTGKNNKISKSEFYERINSEVPLQSKNSIAKFHANNYIPTILCKAEFFSIILIIKIIFKLVGFSRPVYKNYISEAQQNEIRVRNRCSFK